MSLLKKATHLAYMCECVCVQEKERAREGGRRRRREKKTPPTLPCALFLLPTFAEVKPSCSTWVTPFIPLACLVRGKDGARRDVLHVRSFKGGGGGWGGGSQIFETKWHGPPEDGLPGLMQHISISQDVVILD